MGEEGKMGNNLIFGVLEIGVSGQIVKFLKLHPKPYSEREKEKQKGWQVGALALSYSDFGVLYLEAFGRPSADWSLIQ